MHFTYLYFFVDSIAQSNLWDFLKDFLISSVGGGVGGWLLYKLYVNRQERIKNINLKKTACTKALLATQMVLISQIEELYGLKSILINNLNLQTNDNRSLGCLLAGISKPSQAIPILEKVTNLSALYNELSKYIAIKPAYLNTLSLPYEIFSLADLGLVGLSDLVKYFQGLVKSNRKYLEILSRIERNNETRDNIIMHGNISISGLVSTTILLSVEVKNEIENLIIRMSDSFDTTENYIKLIGISIPIPVERDEKGKLIVEPKNYADNI